MPERDLFVPGSLFVRTLPRRIRSKEQLREFFREQALQIVAASSASSAEEDDTVAADGAGSGRTISIRQQETIDTMLSFALSAEQEAVYDKMFRKREEASILRRLSVLPFLFHLLVCPFNLHFTVSDVAM